MWVLLLNDMRGPHVEDIHPVFRANSKQELVDFLVRERVDPYRDGQWGKGFRKGGPLEWFNQPYDFDEYRTFKDAGTEDTWAEHARLQYRNNVLTIPEVT